MDLKIKFNKLVIFKKDGIRLIPLNEIYCIERFNQKTYIQISEDEVHIRNSLKELELILPIQFKRTHRSFIINLQHIKELKLLNDNTFEAFLPEDNQALINRDQLKYLFD